MKENVFKHFIYQVQTDKHYPNREVRVDAYMFLKLENALEAFYKIYNNRKKDSADVSDITVEDYYFTQEFGHTLQRFDYQQDNQCRAYVQLKKIGTYDDYGK